MDSNHVVQIIFHSCAEDETYTRVVQAPSPSHGKLVVTRREKWDHRSASTKSEVQQLKALDLS